MFIIGIYQLNYQEEIIVVVGNYLSRTYPLNFTWSIYEHFILYLKVIWQ